ncbi:hypothetical protein [Ideonella sp.]
MALPTEWTRGEDSLFTKSHLAIIALNEQSATQHALAENSPGKKESSA